MINNIMKLKINIIIFYQIKMMKIVKNYQINYTIKKIKKNMQLKLCKIDQVVQILQKLKLFNKLRINNMIIQLNIMIVDIDNKNKDIKYMNLLQLKWILYILILKKNYKQIFKIIKNLIINIFRFL